MRKYRPLLLLLLAVLGGIILSLTYIRPYEGHITLAEAVLQLSGSRGEFEMGGHLLGLADFTARLLPVFVFEVCFGVMLYRHFCTASVYVFARCPRRLDWYLREVWALACSVLLFQILLMASALSVAALQYRVTVDAGGVLLAACHLAVYAMWTFAMTLLINLFAVWWGSGAGFAVVMGLQMAFVALLALEETVRAYLGTEVKPKGSLLRWNPAAHLVMGWHSSGIDVLDRAIHSSYETIPMGASLLLCLGISIAVVLFGAVFVTKHDLLISDVEKGGI